MCKPEEKIEKLTQEEEMKQLVVKCKQLESIIRRLQANAPSIIKRGRPIQLNIVEKSFIYQLIIPQNALSNINQFSEVHSVLSKFGAILSNMEAESTASIKEAEKKEATEEEK